VIPMLKILVHSNGDVLIAQEGGIDFYFVLQILFCGLA
jgi:hypothetical protein